MTIQLEEPALPAPVPDIDSQVPDGLRLGAGYAWRIIVLAGFVYGIYWVLGYLSEVTVPFVVAILLTAALWPVKERLVRHRVPSGLAAFICLVILLVIILGILTLVSAQIATQWSKLTAEAVTSFTQLTDWLSSGPLHISNKQLDTWLNTATQKIKSSSSTIAGYAASFGSSVGHFFAGLLLALFAFFYFLYEGRKLAKAGSRLLPRRSRGRIMDAAQRGWVALVSYVRAAVIVAAVDGLGALLGAALLGSNMWLAIGALTFLCAFIPLVGAFIAGTVAVAVVLVTLGWVKAIIMLVVVIAVMEIEAHALQPFLLGKAVSLHPLVVLFGLAAGIVIGGIIGGLFTVPLMAFGNAFIAAWSDSTPRDRVPPAHDDFPPPDSPGKLAEHSDEASGSNAQVEASHEAKETGAGSTSMDLVQRDNELADPEELPERSPEDGSDEH